MLEPGGCNPWPLHILRDARHCLSCLSQAGATLGHFIFFETPGTSSMSGPVRGRTLVASSRQAGLFTAAVKRMTCSVVSPGRPLKLSTFPCPFLLSRVTFLWWSLVTFGGCVPRASRPGSEADCPSGMSENAECPLCPGYPLDASLSPLNL